MLSAHLKQYALLMRLDKPIGILLLLWPTLWALWLASDGFPSWKLFAIFVSGVILTRSAGCVVNDIADRHFDKHVARTQHRPLASGNVTVSEAVCLALVLAGSAFLFVLFCNRFTISLAVLGALFAITYPLLKRITHLPQVGLGIAFSWGVPMAFAATLNTIPITAWILFFTAMLWPIIYDTMYAMVDREDDVIIGVKSTAILFGNHERFILGCLQVLFIILLILVGKLFHLSFVYDISILLAASLCIYQQWLIKNKSREAAFKAFLNNNWLGLIIFLGIACQ